MTTRNLCRRGALAATAVVLALGVTACGGDGDDTEPASASDTPSETASDDMSDEASDDATEEETEEASSPDDLAAAAAEAPTDGSKKEFCSSFDMSALVQMGSKPSMSKLRSIQANMTEAGTPAGMPDAARQGWEWFASVSAKNVTDMNQDDLTALGTYYGKNCLRQ